MSKDVAGAPESDRYEDAPHPRETLTLLRHAIAAIGVEQFTFGGGMTLKRQRLAGMRRIFIAIAFRRASDILAHCAAT